MSSSKQYLTSEKLDELKKELQFLITEKRKEVAEHLESAKKLGDLSENAEYHQAREDQAEIEDRIKRLEDLIKNASIASHGGSDTVIIGSTVHVQKNGDNKSLVCMIVGSEEADMTQGKISNMSPLGSSLLGHKKGDTVKVSTPKGVVSYQIELVK